MKNYLLYLSENYSFKILRPLQAEIRKRGDQAKWFVEGDNVNLDYFKEDEALLTSIEEVNAYNPVAVFFPGNLAPGFIPGLKISLFHGFIGGKQRQKDGENYFYIIRDCFDMYCTHGPSSTTHFKTLAQKHKYFDVVETGFCTMDPYYNSNLKDGFIELEKVDDKPIVLFSSTFSPRVTQAPRLLKTIEKLSKNSPWRWWVTFHPKMAQETVDAYKAIQHENLTFIETDNLIPYMEQADIMLADFSSMITDFILLNKPVVTFRNPDGLEHLINVDDEENIEGAIAQALTKPSDLMAKIAKFSEETHPYTDGKSSERVINAVEHKLQNPSKVKKPRNIIRNLKLRKKMSYWKF